MCILTMKSMTNALRAKNALTVRGIEAEVVSLDPKLTKKGCAYGIRFPCAEIENAERTLAAKDIPFGVLIGHRAEVQK